jgi:predicted O-methyltransferase YrrM
VFVDADKASYPVYYEQAIRLLRVGGVVAFDNALWHDRVADHSQRDHETATLRDLVRSVREDTRLVSALLPVSDGLLVAAKR